MRTIRLTEAEMLEAVTDYLIKNYNITEGSTIDVINATGKTSVVHIREPKGE